ncbi:MAG: hypothetical protein KF768_06110 [Phycisphaeraceae bacterium]|nr:hypothetical protein [Phycisphaeraceae bacterium]
MTSPSRRIGKGRLLPAVWVGALACSAIGVAVATQPLPTTRTDFFEPGRQPLELTNDMVSATNCSFCHADYDEGNEPYNLWAASMMAQSARDPVFHAALSIAETDAAFVGDACLRCHSPVGWLRGNVDDTSGASLQFDDFQGVSCSVCHRMIDPVYTPGVSPLADFTELMDLTTYVPTELHNGTYIIDSKDRRRGPFDLDADWGGEFPFHAWELSPFHHSSRLCASCHDVSLPHYTKQTDGSFTLNAYNEPGPSKHLQFPEQRTYSEWANSLFAQGPVNVSGRFGGTRPAVSSCQDCHMPGANAEGCGIGPAPTRPQMPRHTFSGANSWVLAAVRELYFDSESGLSEQSVIDGIERNRQMMAAASDLELSKVGSQLNARVINFTGHKLPTGYPEGRRMWVNVQFYNSIGDLIAERGRYDETTGTLINGGSDTKVYEAVHGIDSTVAALTGHPEGPLFRLSLVNKKFKDNRIPPMGFTNASFAAVGTEPVPAGIYSDGQYWDDTQYAVPPGATRAEVRVFHQTSTREYMEFLRDNDVSPRLSNLPEIPPEYGNAETTSGQLAYNLWAALGKSAPVLMDFGVINLVSCPGDINSDQVVDLADLLDFLSSWSPSLGQTVTPGSNGDFNGDGVVDLADLLDFLSEWLPNLGQTCN